MNTQQNIQLTQQIFQAFAEGNVPFLLNILADDIEWYVAGSREHLPLAGTYQGREQVAQVFQKVGQYLELQHFKPEEFVAQNHQVAVFGKAKGRIRPNNCLVEYDWVHLYTWQEGKVIKFREYLDTGAMASAFQGVNADGSKV
ncbi:MAG: nuclear transport factor 2 family protein [Lyngbya sp.]|nr:nuclear transport factor 2 family protein [Lyngbya sp.]